MISLSLMLDLRLSRAFALCLFSFQGVPLLSQNQGIHWFGSYEEAIREAKRTQKPIFLEFRCEP